MGHPVWWLSLTAGSTRLHGRRTWLLVNTPVGSPAHQERAQELVAAQRRHRNQPSGYWVAGAKPTAAYQAVTGSRPLDEVDRAALLSDGVSCLVELYAAAEWLELLDSMQQHGPTHVISRVRDLEDADPSGSRWPRYKRSDDATARYRRNLWMSPWHENAAYLPP
jgi:hypothetical protein